MLRDYLKNFKFDFDKQAQIGVFNCLQIIKTARDGDMTNEDLTDLDLTRIPLNGCIFAASTKFDRSVLSYNTLRPQGHSDSVNSVVYSKDGQRLLSASNDGYIKEWNRETGECLHVFEGHNSGVYDAVYNDDESCVLSMSADLIIMEWNRETGKCLRTYNALNKLYFTVQEDFNAMPADESDIVTEIVSSNQFAEKSEPSNLNIMTQTSKFPFYSEKYFGAEYTENGEITYCRSVRYSSSGSHIIAVNNDSVISFCKEDDDEFNNLFFSRQFERIRAISRSNVILTSSPVIAKDKFRLFDDSESIMTEYIFNEVTLKYENDNLNINAEGLIGAVYSADESKILLSYYDGEIKEWDRDEKCFLRSLEGSSIHATIVIYSPDEEQILASYIDGTVIEWDRYKCIEIRAYEGSSVPICCLKYSNSKERILVSYADGTIMEWERSTGKCLITIEKQGILEPRCLDDTGAMRFFSASKKGLLLEWNVFAESCMQVVHNQTVSPMDANRIYEDEFSLKYTQLFHINEAQTQLRSFVLFGADLMPSGNNNGICFPKYDTDRKYMLKYTYEKSAIEWRKTMQSLPSAKEIEHGDVIFIAIDSTRQQLFVEPKFCERDAYNMLMEFKDSDPETCNYFLIKFREIAKTILSPVIGENEKVMIAGRDKEIREIREDSGDCIHIYSGHTSSVNCAIYSGDGQRILSSSSDKTIKEWDRYTGECLRTFEGHVGAVKRAMYIENDKYILSVSMDGTFRKWDRKTGKCLWYTPRYDGIFIAGCNFDNCNFQDDSLKDLIRTYGGRV